METAAGKIRLSSPDGRWILVAAVLGSGMAGIDATVVNLALPAIGDDFGASFSALQWTITGYTLTLAAFILLAGSLADRYGRRRLFVIGVMWFAAASALCGLAPNIEILIAARLLQGVGAALLTPGSLAMLQASFRPEDRAKAIGAWSGLSGVATAIGPFLGGFLVESASWRWVFWINLPLALAVVVLAMRHVPETRDEAAVPGLDYAGVSLGVVALAGVTYALVELPERGASWALGLVGTAGLVAAAAFVAAERRSPHPVLPLSIFASRQFSAVNAVTFTVYAGLSAVFFLLVIHLQVVAGFGAVAAGVALLPITVLMLALSARSGELASRIGPRLQMSLGPVVCAAGLLLMLRIGADASYALDVLPAVAVFGLGLSVLVAPLTASALAAAPDKHAGLASGVNNAVARVAGLIAIAALPALSGIGGADYAEPLAFAAGFQTSLWIAAAILLIGGAISWATISNDHLEVVDDQYCCDVGGPTPRDTAASSQ